MARVAPTCHESTLMSMLERLIVAFLSCFGAEGPNSRRVLYWHQHCFRLSVVWCQGKDPTCCSIKANILLYVFTGTLVYVPVLKSVLAAAAHLSSVCMKGCWCCIVLAVS